MNNLSQNIEALGIKELEARQEQLREELRLIQKQIEVAQQVEISIREVIAAVHKCEKRIEEFSPGAKQKMWEAILNCKDGLLPTPLGQWSVAKDKQAEEKQTQQAPVDSDSGESLITDLKDASALNNNKAVENEEDDTHDEAFDEYLDNPAQPEIDINQVAVELVEGQTTAQLNTRPYAEFINLSPKVGYLRRTDDGAILGAYLGGKNKSLLEVWARCISTEVAENTGRCEYEVRPAQRLKNIKYEIKFRDISFATLESLTQVDTSKSPQFRATQKGIEDLEKKGKPAAPSLTEDDPQATTSTTEALVLRVGDRVLVKSDRHGQEYVNQVGIVSAATNVGAAINVGGALRYFHVEEVNMVEQSPEARNPANDLEVSVSAPLDLTDDAVPW